MVNGLVYAAPPDLWRLPCTLKGSPAGKFHGGHSAVGLIHRSGYTVFRPFRAAGGNATMTSDDTSRAPASGLMTAADHSEGFRQAREARRTELVVAAI